MKHSQILLLLQNDFTTCQCEFAGSSKTYTYKVKRDFDLQAGDWVVVESPSTGLTVVKVVEVHSEPAIDLDSGITYKWIVDKVDLQRYQSIREQEEKFFKTMQEIERVKQRDALLKNLREAYPEGSDARLLFDEAVQPFGVPVKIEG